MRRIFNKTSLKLLHQLPAECAHEAIISALKSSSLGALSAPSLPQTPSLRQHLWGLDFAHPLGLAAGFDKNAVAVAGLDRWGFSFLEVGTVTPKAQAGNPRPRLFRLPQDKAIINRMGFNNDGMYRMQSRLKKMDLSPFILGINIGKNKDSADANADYAQCAKTLSPYGDYMVINVSSPNTPGLRAMQSLAPLSELIKTVRSLMDDTKFRPLFVKLAPDLSLGELSDIAKMLTTQALVDGVIMTNTTIERPSLNSADNLTKEAGGLSGAPLCPIALKALKHFYHESEGKIPIIGCGGIYDAQTAYQRLRAGAHLIQLYSALIYHGPQLVFDIVSKLDEYLKKDGFEHISEIIGIDAS